MMKRAAKHSKGFVSGLLILGVYGLPLWYLFTHRGRQEYTGYSWFYGAPLAAALVWVWASRVRESRVAETMAILALAGLQAVLVYLLGYLVEVHDYMRPWLMLALPITAWLALILMAGRIRKWLGEDSARVGGRMTYSERAQTFAINTIVWLLGLVAVALATTFLPSTRIILNDYMYFFLGFFALVGIGLWLTVAIERKSSFLSHARARGKVRRKGVPGSVAEEVEVELARLVRLRSNVWLATSAAGWVAATATFVVLGHDADGIALGLFFLGQVLMIVSTFVVAPWYRRRWHQEVVSSKQDPSLYRTAAKGTPLAFPENDA